MAATDAAFRRCLEEAGLATLDLVGAGKRYFRLTEGDKTLGYGGFEARGGHALLRAIVVEGKARGHGYGRTLVNGLIAETRKLGLKDAYLLTEKAAAFSPSSASSLAAVRARRRRSLSPGNSPNSVRRAPS
jgi:GNAT superfamily N-acetyltransferase